MATWETARTVIRGYYVLLLLIRVQEPHVTISVA